MAYLAGVDDLTLYSSDLVLSLAVVPELRPSKDYVTSEYAHSVELRTWLLSAWESSANNVELSNLNRSQTRYNLSACERRTPDPNDLYLPSSN